jgi:hypothetical protein
MNTSAAVLKSKAVQRRNASYAAEMRKIAFIQFKELAKKNIRLPFEQYHL